MRSQIVEPALDVRETGWRAPMILGRKVDDLHARRIPIKIGLAQAHGLAVAAGLVVVEHGREALLELLGDALAHDADAIDRVDQGLRLALEQVSDKRPNHLLPLAEE